MIQPSLTDRHHSDTDTCWRMLGQTVGRSHFLPDHQKNGMPTKKMGHRATLCVDHLYI